MITKRYIRFIMKIFPLALALAFNTMFAVFYWDKYYEAGSIEHLVAFSTLIISIVALLSVVIWLTMQHTKESVA